MRKATKWDMREYFETEADIVAYLRRLKMVVPL